MGFSPLLFRHTGGVGGDPLTDIEGVVFIYLFFLRVCVRACAPCDHSVMMMCANAMLVYKTFWNTFFERTMEKKKFAKKLGMQH